jgi:ABC-type branched-subunit amino acid transport system permease subunit
MQDDIAMFLSGAGVVTCIIGIGALTLDTTTVTAENVTGPPPDPFLPPLWTVALAAVVSVVLGVAIGTYQTRRTDE